MSTRSLIQNINEEVVEQKDDLGRGRLCVLGRGAACSQSVPLPTVLPLTVIFFLCSSCRALQDVQIRFQPQLNPDVVAPLPSHSTHEDFGELGVRGKWVLTRV